MSESGWRDELLFNRDARTDAARAEFTRRAQPGGDLVRVSTGAYLPAERWHAADQRERYRIRIRIVGARARDPITFSHASAAALWGLPWAEVWPDRVDVVHSVPSRGQYAAGVCRHLPQGAPDIVQLDGLWVTSLTRTVVDIARQRGFQRAVVVGDAALNPATRASLALAGPPITRDDLCAEAARGALAQKRALDVIEFLDGGAASPGESISRVSMWRAGVPAPVLQQPFGRWTVDFWWPEYGVVGEFDGATKYLDAALRRGRTPERVLYDEKLREDEIRQQVKGFARWRYRDAISPARLAARLRAAGLPAPHRTRFVSVSAV